jgi:hypothetical protein
MTEKEAKPTFDYRAISDKIHADYEQTELARETVYLMRIAYFVIHSESPPDLDQLRLRCDR